MITVTNGLTATKEFKAQYNDLMDIIFGFTFEKWFSLNVWDDYYESYSVIEDGKMVANVGVYKMEMVKDGLSQEYLQIGAVATRESHRGKGLSRKILEHIFRIYPNTPAWLFAGDSVLEFYPKFGFTATGEKQPYINCNLKGEVEMVKLEVTNPKVDQYLKGKTGFSKVFDCKNHYAINWFHLINSFHNDLYEIPQLETMIVARHFENVLIIYDIFANKSITFADILPHLHFEGVDTIQFGFNADWLDVEYSLRDYKLEDTTLFFKGDNSLNGGCIVPKLIRT